ncbi:rhomboid-domain-containing protein [Dothidotthia symphoricarpi CBS 119687]|uniref:Rhomboid-type serine protease n=1 Tax=Dothidotthia symphoricarpi CBS 119687 TaxID=1392245 RepID=A0A6A6A811_9PLEO|nr:rhomboid-domain-containing protein [Dothidotthia symphoricarpi CBS 119687]KAF2126791.1 rhomboid-domain-containing protein [Dothidotthia symphoricarpi CBS 119687]
MAANDYYTTTTSSPHDRADAPLPPLPGQHQHHAPTSPFEDHTYPPYPATANSSGALSAHDTSYYGQPQRYDSRDSDPFADHSAIPLNTRPKADASPSRYDADPERYPSAPRDAKRKKKKGWFKGRVTWVCYILTLAQVGVFVGELVKNGMLTGSPIQTKPSFNIMIGPSPYTLINMGSRFTPCMHNIAAVIAADVQEWPCPNTTSLSADAPKCSLSTLCGNGGVPDQSSVTDFHDRSHEPDQWWRFIIPIFLHAGLIHIGFNMLLQLTLGRDMEKEIGPLRFTLVYFSAGIFGFVLGGNYAADGTASVGASGSLFGILALTLLDLLYNWSSKRSPVKDLLFLLLDVAIAFVLGLLPGLDNFSHIGGFAMGLVLGICLLHSPQALRERIGTDEPPYNAVGDTQHLAPSAGETTSKINHLLKQPVGFFKGRKPLWWAWWLVRAGSLVTVFIGFILLLRNFYEWRNTCSWCKHLSCLPITTGGVNWCDIGGLNFTNSTTDSSGTSKRGLGLGIGPADVSLFVAEAVGAFR